MGLIFSYLIHFEDKKKSFQPYSVGCLAHTIHVEAVVTAGMLDSQRGVFTWPVSCLHDQTVKRGEDPQLPGHYLGHFHHSPCAPLRRWHRTAHSATATVVLWWVFNEAPSCGQWTPAVFHQVEKMTRFVSQLAGFFLLSTTSPLGAISSVISVKSHLLILWVFITLPNNRPWNPSLFPEQELYLWMRLSCTG